MPHTLPPSWRDLLRRLPILTAAGLLLAVAAAPASAADKSADKSRGKATQAATSQSGTASGTGSGTEGKGTGGQADTPLPPPPPTTGPSNPMVASVEGHPIYLSDIGRAEKALPANLRGMPFDSIFPVLLDRLVDHQALAMLALRRDLEDNPEVKQQIQDVTDRVLEAALLAQDAVPKVTEAATKARYDAIYANRPATEQVRAPPHPGRAPRPRRRRSSPNSTPAPTSPLWRQRTAWTRTARRAAISASSAASRSGPASPTSRSALQPGQVADQADPQRVRLARGEGGGTPAGRAAQLFRHARANQERTDDRGDREGSRHGSGPTDDPRVEPRRLPRSIPRSASTTLPPGRNNRSNRSTGPETAAGWPSGGIWAMIRAANQGSS